MFKENSHATTTQKKNTKNVNINVKYMWLPYQLTLNKQMSCQTSKINQYVYMENIAVCIIWFIVGLSIKNIIVLKVCKYAIERQRNSYDSNKNI